MAQPMRHGMRGGGRGRNAHWSSIGSSRGSTTGPPANVWTPAIAAASQQLALRQAAPVTSAAQVSGSADAASVTVAVANKHVESASLPPPVKARTSIRKAAEKVEALSKQTAADIELHLQQVESRLALVKAQEEEVRAIVDAHLEREAALKRLLEELYREQQQAGGLMRVEDVKSVTSDQNDDSDPTDSEMEQETPDPPTSSMESVPRNTLPQPSQQQQQQQQQQQELVATVADSTPGKQGDAPGSSSSLRKVSPIQRAGGSGTDSAAATAAPSGGGSRGASGVSGLLLAMAMSMGGPGDGVLTRDASTIEDYILLMSESQGLAAKSEGVSEGGNEVEECGQTEASAWRQQPGLSLSEALDRSEAASTRPPRPVNLLALAALIRPSTAGVSVTATKSQGASGLGKRKATDKAQGQQQRKQQPSGDMVLESGLAAESIRADAAAAADGGLAAPTAREKKRRRLDPNGIMCPFELSGVCNDDNCEYQHAESYLTPVSPSATSTKEVREEVAHRAIPTKESEGNRDKGKAESSSKGLPAVGTEVAAAGSTTTASTAVPRWELPPIDFEAGGDGGSEGQRGKRQETAAKRSKWSGEGESPAREDLATAADEVGENFDEGLDVTGAPRSAGRRSSSSDRETEDGEDFLALETGIVAASGESLSSRSDVSTNETTVDDAGAFLGGASPEDLAKAFARAASIANAGGGGGSRRGAGGQEERYYKDGEGALITHVDSGYGAGAIAANALTEKQVNALEARLEEAPCNVDGWLLVALHRLPREGNSAIAVLNTIEAVARGRDGPLGNADHAALKPALRTLVQGLERGQAETLWILYLRLFAILPGKEIEAIGMVEHALEIYPASPRIWRLYRVMLRRSGRRSLSDEMGTYRRHVDMLLQLRPLAAGAVSADRATVDAAVPPANVVQGTDGPSPKSVEGGDDATFGMVAYLVLERCSVLAEAGYVLQAAADALDALGEVKLVRGWNAAAEDGDGKPLLRAPSQSGNSGGSEGRGIHGRLPEDVVVVLKRAPRGMRCLIWLTALHLLVMGVFPRPVLGLAEEGGCSDQGRYSHGAGLLWWPKEWLLPESSAGVRLSKSAELLDAATKVFMSALQDAGLLPAEDGHGGGWAPPMRVRDALLPSSAEAKAARTGGMAPETSALAGPSLALALNWLTFCCRREHGLDKGVRSVALACCRRFQLSRPDHPLMLEHLLLEHDVSRSRSLEDVYREISRAFSKGGAASEALRERGEPARSEDSGSGHQAFLSPSSHQLQALYCFLRFAQVRLRTIASRTQVHVSQRPSPSMNSSDSVAPQAADASESAVEAQREIEVGCDLLREVVVEMWAPVWASKPDSGLVNGASGRSLREDNGEYLRLALEGAKASLSRWADGFPLGDSRVDEMQVGPGGAMANLIGNAGCRLKEDDALSAGRQLSSISFALWVLGGPSEATRALDHLLSAESFAKMPPERRRLAWLQRLEAALIISDQGTTAVDPMQEVREVVLRALADPRTEHRPDCDTITGLLESALDRSWDGESLSAGGRMAENASSSAASFAYDVLMLYAKGFREMRGGVDWAVVAEALGNGDRKASANKVSSCGSLGIAADSAASSACVRALLLWVNQADESESESEHGPAMRAGGALALRRNARPYAEMALARDKDDTDLAGIVAALEASTGRPDRAQRILESALSRHGLCSMLWEQRIALEVAFGRRSKERASVTSLAAASKEVLLRLRCVIDGVKIGSGRSDPLSTQLTRQSMVLPARVAGRMLATVSNSSLRKETKSLSLQGALLVPDKTGTVKDPPIRLPAEVPKSLFLLKGLVNLSLAGNGLEALPSSIGSLVGMRSLDVSNNALTTLPRSLSKLSGSLRLLRLAGNRLTSPLASSPLGDLVSLRLLDLENNALTGFPEEVVMALKELRTLKLAGNRSFQRAPSSLTDALPHLEQLTLP